MQLTIRCIFMGLGGHVELLLQTHIWDKKYNYRGVGLKPGTLDKLYCTKHKWMYGACDSVEL